MSYLPRNYSHNLKCYYRHFTSLRLNKFAPDWLSAKATPSCTIQTYEVPRNLALIYNHMLTLIGWVLRIDTPSFTIQTYEVPQNLALIYSGNTKGVLLDSFLQQPRSRLRPSHEIVDQLGWPRQKFPQVLCL